MLAFWDVRGGSRLLDSSAARQEFRRALVSNHRPYFDVTVDKDQTRVTADVPGYKPEDIEVTVNGEGHLTVKGTNEARGDFERVWSLPKDADPESLTASLKDGVLAVTITALPKVEPRKIPVLG